jgi:hypothetical protein
MGVNFKKGIFGKGILPKCDQNCKTYNVVTVKARRNTYGSYQSLPWGTSWEIYKNHSRVVSHRNYFTWRK